VELQKLVMTSSFPVLTSVTVEVSMSSESEVRKKRRGQRGSLTVEDGGGMATFLFRSTLRARRKRGWTKGITLTLAGTKAATARAARATFLVRLENGRLEMYRAEFASRRGRGEFFYVDEEGQEGDGAVRYRVTDLARRNEMPFAVLNTWNEFVEIRDQFPGWFHGHRERWEVPHSRNQRRHVIGRDFLFWYFSAAETEESALFIREYRSGRVTSTVARFFRFRARIRHAQPAPFAELCDRAEHALRRFWSDNRRAKFPSWLGSNRPVIWVRASDPLYFANLANAAARGGRRELRETRKDARDVAVEHGMFFAEGDAQNRRGGVVPMRAMQGSSIRVGNCPACFAMICCAAFCRLRARL